MLKKRKYMISSYRRLLHLTNIKIGSTTIEETNNIKFLGIIFDKHLTFKNQVDVIAREIYESVGKVWHGTYANITNKIFILQKKACRAIHNLPFNTHTTEYFKKQNI